MDRNSKIAKLAREPKNRRWYYMAVFFLGTAMVLLFSMLIWFEKIPIRTMLFMRGCVGLCAIISVVFAAIFFYKVYREYHKLPNR